MRHLFLVVALLQFIVPVLPRFGVGVSIGDRAIMDGIGPELPTGVFFAIWGIIFSGYLWVAVWHWRAPNGASDVILRPLIFAGGGNLIWMLSAQIIGIAILDFILLWPILAASWYAAQALHVDAEKSSRTWRDLLHSLVVGLLAGWLCVAISISIPEVARLGLQRAPSDAVWQSLWLTLIPAAVLAALFKRFVSHNIWFFVALSWGLFGIFWNTYFRLDLHALGLVTLLFGVIVLRIRLARQTNLGAQFYG